MRCSNSEIFRKLNLDLIDERSEIEFTLLSDLPNCRMINTSNTLTGSSTGSFDIYAVPQNAFECDSNSCQNSGTYTSTAAAAAMIYRGAFDAREIAAGVMTFFRPLRQVRLRFCCRILPHLLMRISIRHLIRVALTISRSLSI